MGKRPARDERQPCPGGRQRPAQVIQHLPSADERDPRPPASAGASSEDPGQQLPISPRPAVLPHHRALVVGRELLEQLEIGDESSPREDPLEEVMAQQRVLRNPPGQGGLEGIHVIDALACVGALSEQVLVDIRDGGRIRVDPRRPGEDPLKQGPLTIRRHRGRDARLQHRVPVDDPARLGIERRAIERVRHQADETGGGAPGKTRIRVEGDDEPNVGGDGRTPTRDRHERRVARPPKQAVELVKLAALALPPHPLALGRVPHTPAMQQEKAIAAVGRRTVATIQIRDALGRRRHQRRILGHRLGRRVHMVGQEREANVPVRIGEVVDLEPADLLVDVGFAREQRRHHDEGSEARRHPITKLEARQQPRAEQLHDGAIDEGDGEIRRREKGDQPEQCREHRRHTGGQRCVERDGEEKRRHERDAAQVARCRGGHIGAKQPPPRRDPVAEVRLEGRPPLRDEVVSGIR